MLPAAQILLPQAAAGLFRNVLTSSSVLKDSCVEFRVDS